MAEKLGSLVHDLPEAVARLYVDETSRQKFLANPRGAVIDAGLSAAEMQALVTMDRVGLEMAAASFVAKRARAPRIRMSGRVMRWLRAMGRSG